MKSAMGQASFRKVLRICTRNFWHMMVYLNVIWKDWSVWFCRFQLRRISWFNDESLKRNLFGSAMQSHPRYIPRCVTFTERSERYHRSRYSWRIVFSKRKIRICQISSYRASKQSKDYRPLIHNESGRNLKVPTFESVHQSPLVNKTDLPGNGFVISCYFLAA